MGTYPGVWTLLAGFQFIGPSGLCCQPFGPPLWVIPVFGFQMLASLPIWWGDWSLPHPHLSAIGIDFRPFWPQSVRPSAIFRLHLCVELQWLNMSVYSRARLWYHKQANDIICEHHFSIFLLIWNVSVVVISSVWIHNGCCKYCSFTDIYVSTGEVLGEGSFGQVITHRNINTGKEFAVKVWSHFKCRTFCLRENQSDGSG